ncbi:MAG: glycosyl transferase family 1 [Burkholderiales bacterium RIFCSPLOWO2_12_FULL_64_99]|nr:MAG: glycosyl transferase family 1 [Burkholderiales bacterium RIFCSPHIGHO2_12_FULL_63_20]OGB62457.1 MAG: glycosyl transferase family 1 [Burkholderiales bacterium RIFCSPLOWO2_12_FULL_64_99]
MSDQAPRPALLVYSSLFPSPVQPNAGVFVRERMFRVGAHLPIVVVAPTPWFPFQSVLRMFKPHFRPRPPAHQQQDGVDVWYPRYFSIPGVFKQWDGVFMALSTYAMVKRLRQAGRADIIDAHFAYPDGYAATLLGRWLKVPVAITLRGTEARHARTPALVGPLKKALQRATRLIAVSSELKRVALELGADPARTLVVGNGVDISKFQPHPKDQARAKLGIAPTAQVLISVGGLVERKGFHRVIPLLPELLKTYPDLVYLIVGGASAEGDNRAELEKMVAELGLGPHVRFLGPKPHDALAEVLSAADVFVLATSAEGWANVFLEAMACGVPVVTTDVGGNREVVCRSELGEVVPFGDAQALSKALQAALRAQWNAARIRQYAQENAWPHRVQVLLDVFRTMDKDPHMVN